MLKQLHPIGLHHDLQVAKLVFPKILLHLAHQLQLQDAWFPHVVSMPQLE